MYKNKKEGFTLAEVLIALVIIGVVAAITVPTIVANSQEEEIKSSLKKNYSVLQQAMKRYYIDNGEYYTFDGKSTYDFRKEFILKYFNVIEDCIYRGCKYNAKEEYKNYSGKGTTVYGRSLNTSDPAVILQDGSYLSYAWNSGRLIFIDVNGRNKKPNTLGKDLFFFCITNGTGKIIPGGASGCHASPNYCDKKINNDFSGTGCTAKMLR